MNEARTHISDDYDVALDAIAALKKPLMICTVYEGREDLPNLVASRAALTRLNDVILRAAVARRLPVLDLRFVCTDFADYGNPIELSGRGGLKIARAILAALDGRGGAAKVHRG